MTVRIYLPHPAKAQGQLFQLKSGNIYLRGGSHALRNHHPYQATDRRSTSFTGKAGSSPAPQWQQAAYPWWEWPSHCLNDNLLPVEGTGINYSLRNRDHLHSYWGASHVTLVVKSPTARAGRPESRGSGSWVRNIPWRRRWQPTPVFLPGESHGHRSLTGCSP